MQDDRHRRLRAAFEAALLQDPSARDDFLSAICADDAELGRRVSQLLAAHESAGSFLERSPAAALEDTHAEEFRGTGRFTIRGTLGTGGMAIVYEVHDRVRDEVVALKTLRRKGAIDLYLLKREFRGLANIAHRNLVCLYELFVDEEHCFFTMELVRGANFVDHVRAAASEREARVVSAFAQLVEGVSALHRAGKLHRDIKPSNVLVTADGRVVILDFGLIAELTSSDRGSIDAEAGGTPAYMSPEEAAGAAPSEASDWYAVGVTLYESLTGRLPFAGSWPDVLMRKRDVDPTPACEIASDVPTDLDEICRGMLRRDPAQRLSGRDALGLLRRHENVAVAAAARTDDAAVPPAPFVGREREIAALLAAFETTRRGSAATVYIAGRSGIGKTALVGQFLERARTAGAVVFSGRCYEHESVPYKALDGVVDNISRYLCALSRPLADSLLPRDAATLSRLFPVLRQVEALRGAAAQANDPIDDPTRLRQRAIAALRDLLALVAARQPVVVFIDDLQWTDADSVIVLNDILGRAAPAGVLTILCARGEEIAANALLRSALEAGRDDAIRVVLDPMSETEASMLIAAVVPERDRPAIDAAAIVREAEGNPFLLEQFARHIALDTRPADRAGARTTFADVFAGRLRTLPAEAQPFLETLALCGRPMAPEIVGDASGLGAAIRPLVGQLRAAHVIRSSGSSERIETYHDRIREALVERMDAAAVRRRHGQLAGALRARHVDDPEALFEHLRGAGDHSEAAVQAGRTADRAASALAFDTAAAFYRDALDLASDSPSRQSWQAGRAAALANAGRPHEAGEAYLEASRDASAAGGIDLQRRAAEQFLIGGHIDRGLAMLRSVLDQVEIKFPAGPRAALASLLTRRARLGLRGLGFVERKASDVPADVLFRIDTCWSVMTGLATVDMIRAAAFSALHLHLALDAGEPYRIARALAVEAAFAAMPGGKNRTRAARLFERARQLAAALDRPHTNALLAVTSGMAALAGGRWRDASDLCEQALVILRDRCAGATWEINSAQNFLLGALLYQGELHEVATRVHPLLEEARSRGNLYVSTELCTRMNLVWLAADRPDEGERLAIESIDRWSQSGFHRQHYSAMLARVQTALYRGDARLAWTLLDESWPALQPTMLLRAQVVRVEAAYLRGRCAIAMASAGADARTFLRIALECARRIAGEDMFWSDPIARLLEACAAHLRRDDELSAARLAEAIDGFDRAGMQLYAAAARRRLADLAGGEKAHDARRRFDEWAARQRVVNPGAMTRMMAPGCRDY